MWRRTYLALTLLRLHCALCPSYLHPDENFQGPEVIAGRIFAYPVTLTWEFTSDAPVRSAFPLWPVYGLPMIILRWMSEGFGKSSLSPAVIFWTIRVLMFTLSFVLQDWAMHELIEVPRKRRLAILLVASSYVTWTWQTHTFSNSIETILVLWTLVIAKRLRQTGTGLYASGLLGSLLVFGSFNRITFPAYVVASCLPLFRIFTKRLSLLTIFVASALFTFALAVITDTVFYHGRDTPISTFFKSPVITPLNNLRYNSVSSNLAEHGHHPFYQHILINLPQLIGPAFVPVLTQFELSLPFTAAATGIALLSLIPHQEARFLLPAVPLILSSIRIPPRYMQIFLWLWIPFNIALGGLMGVYHQGGIIPAQIWLGRSACQSNIKADVFWWKTYPPPKWLLDGQTENVRTFDLMGMPTNEWPLQICSAHQSLSDRRKLLVAPRSATFLDRFLDGSSMNSISLNEIWTTRQHINLDDLDFGDDGFWATLKRVVGRRGLTIWDVRCPGTGTLAGLGLDW